MSEAAPCGKPGVDAGRGVEIGIGRGHDRGHRAAGRQARHIDAGRVDGKLGHDGAGEAREDRRLARRRALVGELEPVPAGRAVGAPRLPRLGDEEAALLGERVHAPCRRRSRRGSGCSRAASRRAGAGLCAPARDVDLVVARARRAGEGLGEIRRAFRNRRRRAASASPAIARSRGRGRQAWPDAAGLTTSPSGRRLRPEGGRRKVSPALAARSCVRRAGVGSAASKISAGAARIGARSRAVRSATGGPAGPVSARWMTRVASITFCERTRFRACRMAAPKSDFMGPIPCDEAVAGLSNAVGERRLDLFAGVEGAEDRDGLDRLAGEVGRDVVVDRREPDDLDLEPDALRLRLLQLRRVTRRRPSSSVWRTIDCLTASAWDESWLRIAVRMKSVRFE